MKWDILSVNYIYPMLIVVLFEMNVEIRSGIPPAPELGRPPPSVRRQRQVPLPERHLPPPGALDARHLLHQARGVQSAPSPGTHGTQDFQQRIRPIHYQVYIDTASLRLIKYNKNRDIRFQQK